MVRGHRRVSRDNGRSTQDPNQAGPPVPPGERVVTTQVSQASYSGPLPPSTELEAYEKILPGAADRVVSMAESYAAQEQRLERDAMRHEASAQRWGRAMAAVVVAAILGACMYALHLGYDEFATRLGS